MLFFGRKCQPYGLAFKLFGLRKFGFGAEDMERAAGNAAFAKWNSNRLAAGLVTGAYRSMS